MQLSRLQLFEQKHGRAILLLCLAFPFPFLGLVSILHFIIGISFGRFFQDDLAFFPFVYIFNASALLVLLSARFEQGVSVRTLFYLLGVAGNIISFFIYVG